MTKIRKIKRKDLEEDKYTASLQASVNYRVYAEFWYLDLLTKGKWECLVYGDYEVLMPIPLQYKWGLKFVLQPFYCQQLGVFYKEEISTELFQAFEKRLHRYFVRAYCFNEENTQTFHPKGEQRVNQIIELQRSYEEIRSSFNKNRKRELGKKMNEEFYFSQKFDQEWFDEIRRTQYETFVRAKNEKLSSALIKNLQKYNSFYFLAVKKNEAILAAGIFIRSAKRFIFLFPIRDKTMESKGAMTLLMDEFFRRNSGSKTLLDFEGSSLDGVYHFNESLGAQPHFYARYKNI